MVFTGYFGMKLPIDRSVSIARKSPKSIKAYPSLVPSSELLYRFKHREINISDYAYTYYNQLYQLDCAKVYGDLNGKVALCYEHSKDFCHRKLVRKWFAVNGYLSLEYKQEYNIGIVGDRNFNDEAAFLYFVEHILSGFYDDQKISIVTSDASGSDSMARRYAQMKKYDATIFPTQWKKHGKRAIYQRNKQIWKESDFVIAFYDGLSSGMSYTLQMVKKYKKILLLYRLDTHTYAIYNEEPL